MQDLINEYLAENKESEEVKKELSEILKNERYKQNEKSFPEIEPISLVVKDLQTIKSAEIDYKKKPINDITGYNKAGKTLLLEVPKMIWFNKGRDVLKNIINNDTYIKLVQKINGDEYSIVIEKKDWILYKGDPVKVSGQKKVLEELVKMGIDDPITKGGIRDLFFMIKEKDYITEKDPADIKKMFMDTVNAGACDLIKDDSKKMVDNIGTDITRMEGQVQLLEPEEGEISLDVDIKNLSNDIKDEKKLKEELLNIATDGADIVAKKVDEIEENKKAIQEKEELIEKVKTVEKHKTVFSDLDKLNEKQKKQQTGNDKIKAEKEKLESKIRDIEFRKDKIQDSLDDIKNLGDKCELCESEVSYMHKNVIEKKRFAEIEGMIKDAEKLIVENNKLKLVDTDYEIDIDKLQDIIRDELKLIGIKGENGIKNILDKYNMDTLQKELLKLNNDKIKLKKDYDKLLQADKSERKKELEKKLEDIKNAEVEIVGLKQKKKTVQENKKKMTEINAQIKDKQSKKKVVERIFELFDKNDKDSFPIWLISKSLLNLQKRINDDLKGFDNLGLTLEINKNFDFLINNGKTKVKSNSEVKILNLVAHVNILKDLCKVIPYIGIDESYSGLEDNTTKNLNEVIDKYIKDGLVRNIVLTNPADNQLKIN